MNRMRLVEELTRSMRDSAPAAPQAARRSTYLHPGQMLVASKPHAVTTVLGSCVGVCLHDRRLGIGGINHFLLPSGGVGPATNRIGATAMPALIREMHKLGCQSRDMEASVFGGACVLDAFRGREDHIGVQNAEVALAYLRGEGIRITEQDIGGDHGRKLRFHTDDGSVSVQQI
jgi:chemotaxis protein CheD